jgi:hypothetical protein
MRPPADLAVKKTTRNEVFGQKMHEQPFIDNAAFGNLGSQLPLDRSQHVSVMGAPSLARTAHCCRSCPPSNAAVRPTEAATRASRSILSAETSVCGDTVEKVDVLDGLTIA